MRRTIALYFVLLFSFLGGCSSWPGMAPEKILNRITHAHGGSSNLSFVRTTAYGTWDTAFSRLSPTGRFWAYTTLEGFFYLVEPGSGQELFRLAYPRQEGSLEAAFSPDEKYMVVFGRYFSSSYLIYDLEKLEVVNTIPGSFFSSIRSSFLLQRGPEALSAAFSGDSLLIVTTMKIYIVKSFADNEAMSVSILDTGIKDIAGMAPGNPGKVYLCSYSGKLALFSTEQEKVLKSIRHQPGTTLLGVPGKGVLLKEPEGMVYFYDEDLNLLFEKEIARDKDSCFVSPGGEFLGLGSRDQKEISFYTLEKGFSPLPSLAMKEPQLGVGFTNQGQFLLVLALSPGLWSVNVAGERVMKRLVEKASYPRDLGMDEDHLFLDLGNNRQISFNLRTREVAGAASFPAVSGLPQSVGETSLSLLSGGMVAIENQGESHYLQNYTGLSFSGLIDEETGVAFSRKEGFQAYNLSGQLLFSFQNSTAYPLKALIYDHWFLYLDQTGTIRIWDLRERGGARSLRPYLNLGFTGDGEWVAWDDLGYYDASPGGEETLMVVHENLNLSSTSWGPIKKYQEVFHNPSYIDDLFSGKLREKARIRAIRKGPFVPVYDSFPGYNLTISTLDEDWMDMSAFSPLEENEVFCYRLDDLGTLFSGYAWTGVEAFSPGRVEELLEGFAAFEADLPSPARNFMKIKDYTLDGLPGKLGIYAPRKKGLFNAYASWCGVRNGVFYLFTAKFRTPAGDRELIDDQIDYIFESVHFMKDSYKIGASEWEPFHSRLTDGRITLSGGNWFLWEDLDQSFPAAEIGGLYRDTGAFVFIPLYLGELDPSLNALAYSYMNLLDIDFTQAEFGGYKKMEEGTLKGLQVDYTEPGEDAFSYRMQVWKGADFALFTAYWSNDKKMGMEAFYSHLVLPSSWKGMRVPSSQRAVIFNDIGYYYLENQQYGASAPFFETALSVSPELQAAFSNWLYASSFMGKYKEALEGIEKQDKEFRELPEVLSYKAFFLKQLGREEEAVKAYHLLFQKGHEDDYDFSAYIELLNNAREFDQAKKEIEAYKKKSSSNTVLIAEASVYTAEENWDPGVRLLNERFNNSVYNQELTLALLDILYSAGRFKEGLEICDMALEEGDNSAVIHFHKGLNALELKWYSEAKKYFETAGELNPSDSVIQGYIEYVSGFLGEGDNSSIKEEISAVPVDEAFLTREAPENWEALCQGQDSCYDYYIKSLHYEKDKDYRETKYFQVKVLTEKGVSSFSSMEFPFNPLNYRIYVNSLEVYDDKGELKSRGRVEDYYVIDDNYSELATFDRVLVVPVAGLEPGYTIKVVITTVFDGLPESFPFYLYQPYRYSPIALSGLVITGDTGELNYDEIHSQAFASPGDGLAWLYSGVEPVYTEPQTPYYHEFLPVVMVGDKSPSWQSEVDEYFTDIKEQMVLTDEVRQLAGEITTGAASKEEEFALLARYVQSRIVYKGIEFGRRAWVPNKPGEVLANKYGDCKDHALLLHILLEARGIPSYLTLISAGDPVSRKVASSDQFDHMILYLPEYRGGFFTDPTDKYYDLARDMPRGLWGQTALVMNPGAPELITLPGENPEGASRLVIDREVTLLGGGEIEVKEAITASGFAGANLREYFSYEQDEDSLFLQLYSGTGAFVSVEESQIRGLKDTGEPLVIEVTYVVSNYFHESEGQAGGRIPFILEQLYLTADPVKERKTPFHIYVPLQLSSRVTFRWTQDYSARKKGGDSITEETPFISWDLKRRDEPSALEWTFDLESKAGSFEAAEYEEYIKVVRKIIKTFSREVLLVP